MGRIFLTGATGFVGQHILKELERQGLKTMIAVRPGWQSRLSINTTLTSVVETDDLFQEDHDWWCQNLRVADLVIHSAWVATPGSYLTSLKNIDCLLGTLSMARAAVEVNLRRFVGLGTCVEYAMSQEALSVESRLDPSTPYAAAKLSAFLTLREVFARSDTSFLWCRLFHPFGPGEHPDRLVPFLHRQLGAGQVAELSKGHQLRDFIEVSEAAASIVAGALSDVTGPANICRGEGKSVRDLALEIAAIYGRPDLLKFGAKPDSPDDPKRIVGIPTKFDG